MQVWKEVITKGIRMTKKNSKTKMPAILFYTGDWLKDPAVRCLSLEARGLWIDMLCLMYESPVRGFLSVGNGTPVTAVLLARMVGGQEEQVQTLLDELNACGVYSVDENGTMYSRRMVADEKLRVQKSEAGKKGMKSRYNKSDNTPDNKVDNKVVTRLEYEYENEIESETNSSNTYLVSRKSREESKAVDFVVNAIPKSRYHNPRQTKFQIRRVLDVAIGNGQDEMDSAKMLAERIKLYYESEEGRGEYFKTPHRWLQEDCHLVDPSVWDSRKKQQETTGWGSVDVKGS